MYKVTVDLTDEQIRSLDALRVGLPGMPSRRGAIIVLLEDELMRAHEMRGAPQAQKSAALLAKKWGDEIAKTEIPALLGNTETGDTYVNKWKSDNLPKMDAVAARKGPLTIAPAGSMLKGHK